MSGGFCGKPARGQGALCVQASAVCPRAGQDTLGAWKVIESIGLLSLTLKKVGSKS